MTLALHSCGPQGTLAEIDDTASKLGLGTIIDRARADEVMVYGIGLESNFFDGVRMIKSKPDRGLKKRAYRINSPTLLLWGESDRLVPKQYAKAFDTYQKALQVAPNDADFKEALERVRPFAKP